MERTKERRSIRDYFRLMVVQRGSPESIAWGVAIGVFIAFTPTLGIQIILGLLVAWIVRVNRIATIVPLFLTNVLTAGPVYGFECWLGAQFLPDAKSGEMVARWERLSAALSGLGVFSAHDLHAHWREIARVGWDLWLAMWIGGILVGCFLAVPSYFATLAVVRRYRERRARRLRTRSQTRSAGA